MRSPLYACLSYIACIYRSDISNGASSQFPVHVVYSPTQKYADLQVLYTPN